MPKIRKKTSKRLGFREKYCVLKKVNEHQKKIRKKAKKMAQAGIKPQKKKAGMVVPNSFPDKEALLNEMEAKALTLKEAQKQRSQQVNGFATKIKAAVEVQAADPNAKYGGLTEEDIKEAEYLIDPEGVQDIAAAQISKKGYWSQIKKACLMSDVVIQVLDARDPEGTRSEQLHELCQEEGKKIIYLINKTDLVPEENLKAWLKHYKDQDLLCLPVRGNLYIDYKAEQAKAEGEGDEEQPNEERLEHEKRKERILKALFKYQRKFQEKKDQEQIVIAVMGFTNSGKSSIINSLCGRIAAASSSQPFVTQKLQEIRLNRGMVFIDAPAIILQQPSGPDGKGTKVVRSALQVDEIADPITAVNNLLAMVEKTEILLHYRIGNYDDVQDMLAQVAVKKGFVEMEEIPSDSIKGKKQAKKQKKQVPNIDQAARRVIRDFLNNKLNYCTKVPE